MSLGAGTDYCNVGHDEAAAPVSGFYEPDDSKAGNNISLDLPDMEAGRETGSRREGVKVYWLSLTFDRYMLLFRSKPHGGRYANL